MLNSAPIIDPQGVASALADVVLEVGSILFLNGAPSQKIHDAMVCVAERMGCEIAEAVVGYDHLILSLTIHGVTLSRVKGMGDSGVNFFKVAAIERLCYALKDQPLSLEALKKNLEIINKASHPCPIWALPLLLGIGCSMVGQIFGADLQGFGVGFFGTLMGEKVFIWVYQPKMSPYVVTFLAAFVTGFVVNVCVLMGFTQTAVAVLSSSVLYLVPGIPMICGFLDVLWGHIAAGHARLMNMCVSSVAIALGLLCAIKITNGIWTFFY